MAWNYNSSDTQKAFADYRQQKEQTSLLPGWLTTGLEALGRPQRGVFGALEAGFGGRNPVEGFTQGFMGPAAEFDPASRFEKMGYGTLPVGPFDTRGLAGFAAGLVTDPLTYLPGPGTLLKAGRTAAPLARAAEHAIPLVEEGVQSGFRPSALRTAAQTAARIPGVDKFIRWAVSPRILAETHADRALVEGDRVMDTVSRLVETRIARLRARPFESPIVDGFITGPNGKRGAWGDVFQSEKLQNELELTTQDLQFIKTFKDIWQPLRSDYEELWKKYKAVSPIQAEKYKITDIHLAEDEDFISRIWQMADGKLDYKPRARPLGVTRGVQRPRGEFSMEQGIEMGLTPIDDPIQVATERVNDIMTKMGEMSYATSAILDAKKVIGFGGHEGLRATAETLRENRRNLKTMQDVVAGVVRGETVPSQTYARLRRMGFSDEWIDQLQRQESRRATPPINAPIGTPGGIFKGGIQEELPTGLTKPGVIGEIRKLDPTRKVGELRRLPRSELDTVLFDLRKVGPEDLPPAPSGPTFGPPGERTWGRPGEPARAIPSEPSGIPTPSFGRGGVEVRTVPNFDRLKKLQGDLGDLMDQNSEVYKQVLEDYKAGRAGEAGEIVSKGLQEVTRVPMLGNAFFEPEVAARLSQHFAAQAEPSNLLTKAGEVSSFARGMQSGYDIGGPLLQGLPILASHPEVWFRGAARMFQMLKDPNAYQRWLARPEIQQFFKSHPDLMVSSRYQFETLERGQIGERLIAKGEQLPGPLGTAGRGFAGLTSRAQTAYEGPLAYMRVELARALEPKFVGRERDLDNLVNHMTGMLSAKSLGQGTNQRNVESLMFYSSQYLRASLALVGDMFSENPETRKQAMNGIWSLIKVGHLAYDHVSEALGQKPIYDPKDGRFFTWDIGGTRVGIGSNWVALLRLFGRAIEDPTSFVNINDVPDNPLVKFLRGRTSPIVGELADLVTNETFTGEPVTNLGQAAKVTGERLLPFGLTAAAEGARGGGVPGGITEALTSAAGLRAFPAGLRDIRNDVAKEMFGDEFTNLDPIQKATVSADERVKSQPVPPGGRFEDERKQRDIQQQYADFLEGKAVQVQQGKIDRKDFREAVNQARLVRDTRRAEIPAQERPGPRAQADQDRDKYFAILKQKDEFGRTDFEAADEFLAGLPATSRTLIKAAEQASLVGLGPGAEKLMTELSATRDKLAPYWEAREVVLKRAALWDKWLDATPHERRVIEASPVYKAAEKIWDKRREAMRLHDATMDKMLMAWGYTSVPVGQSVGQKKVTALTRV